MIMFLFMCHDERPSGHYALSTIIPALLVFSFVASAAEVLLSDDFQSGVIGEQWVFYGDPASQINQNKGNPAPCFNNNGDNMWASGVKSREAFSLSRGLVVECDLFLSCHPRGAWVASSMGLCATDVIGESNQPTELVGLTYRYSGELDWSRPHLQGVLNMIISPEYYNEGAGYLIHMNKWLNDWHKFRIEVSPSGVCSFSVDDSLISSYPVSFPEDFEVNVYLGGRATSWGIALHDNLRVYVP